MAEKKKNITQIIRDSFKQTNQELNADSLDALWNDFKNKAGKQQPPKIDKIVADSFNQTHEPKLPENAWNDMQNRLDIETVWKNIDNVLTKRKKRIYYHLSISAMLLILFIISIPKKTSFNKIASLKTKNETLKKDFIQQNKLATQNTKETSIDKQKNKKTAKNTLKSTSKTDKRTPGYNVSKTVVVDKANNNNNELAYNTNNKKQTVSLNNIKINTLENIENIKNQEQPFDYYIEKIIPKSCCEFSGSQIDTFKTRTNNYLLTSNNSDAGLNTNSLSFGIEFQLNNTWIIDSETKQGFSEQSLVLNKANITPSVGVYINKKINSKYLVSISAHFISSQKTTNYLYLNGSYTKKVKQINYYKLNPSVSRVIALKNGNNIHITLGGYMALANKMKIQFSNNEGLYYIKAPFSSYDWGMISGISFNKKTSKYDFSIGPTVNYGLKNIYQSKQQIPDYLIETKNLAVGLKINVGFLK